MDKIKLELKLIVGSDFVNIDDIFFKDIAYIQVIINEINTINTDTFEGSFVVFTELKKSCYNTGNYLIFTSVTGIADDGGWDYIKVKHNDDSIKWSLNRNGLDIRYKFKKSEYLDSIEKLELLIKNLDSKLTLEPSHVIYPEIY